MEPGLARLHRFRRCFHSSPVFFGHLPDKLGGAKVALVSVLIEASGQALIWLAPRPWLQPKAGASPSGSYTACLDLALGIANPVLGLVGGGAGLDAVFRASAFVVLCAAVIATALCYLPLEAPSISCAAARIAA
jgi:hypothetical protein